MLKDCRVHTTLPVSDMARARAFYSEKLGMTPVEEFPTGIFYECGDGTRFALSQMGAKPAGHTQMGFVVRDLVSEVKQLKSLGLVFEEYNTKGAWFKDSEGNIIGMMQPVQQPVSLRR